MGPGLSPETSDSSRKQGFFGIRTRMIICFSVAFASILAGIMLAQVFGVPFTSYGGVWETYKFEAMHDLNLVADLKVERLQLWVKERRNDLRVLASNRHRLAAIQSLQTVLRAWRAEGLQESEVWRRLLEQSDYRDLVDRLNEVKATHSVYGTMFIVDAGTGVTLVSTQESDLGADNRQETYYRKALESSDDYVSDVQWSSRGDRAVIYFSRVMRADQDKLGAVLVFEANTEDMIAPILHTGLGLGDRGEALLVNHDVRILTTLKHPLADGSRAKPLAYQLATQPATRAARGEKGVVETTDYRGEPVLAAYRGIQITAELGWGLVVKRDLAELYAPLYREIAYTLGIALLGLGAVIVLTMLVAQNLTRPIRALSVTAQLVAEGDLSVRASATANDEVGALAAMFNTMIARIQAEQEVRVRQERLAAIGQLTASVAHELRNPLGTIRTACYLISGRLRGRGPGLEHPLDVVERSIDRCDAIVADLLDYGRCQSLQRTPIAIDAWLDRFFGEQEIPEGIRVRCDLAAGITLPLDEERLRRCMVNLVTNACQAMQPPGGELTVTSRLQDGVVTLSVADTGCGIPADQQEKVFEPLFSTKSFGVGLGLPIVKQIVEQHGGCIELQSTPGQGTIFEIALPTSSTD